jgi:DedD protein
VADKNSTSQDFNPKHRIVGAIVLVLLAVIILPMVLKDNMPAVSEAPVPEAPTPDTRVVVTPVTPEAPQTSASEPVVIKTIPSLVAPPASPAPQADSPAATDAAAPAAEPAVAPVPDSAAKPAKSPAPSVAAVKKGWIVQLGVFGQTDNATRMKDDLKRHGYSVSFDRITLDKGQGVRVRVGPYASESEARAALARIQKDTGIKGVVRAYP